MQYEQCSRKIAETELFINVVYSKMSEWMKTSNTFTIFKI